MGCFNDPAWTTTTRRVCVWWGGGGVADTNYLYPARWGWIKSKAAANHHHSIVIYMLIVASCTWLSLSIIRQAWWQDMLSSPSPLYWSKYPQKTWGRCWCEVHQMFIVTASFGSGYRLAICSYLISVCHKVILSLSIFFMFGPFWSSPARFGIAPWL